MCYSFVPQLLQENHFQIGNLTFWRSREVPPGSYLLLLTVLPNIFISFPLIVSYGWRSLKCSCEQCYLSTCLDCHYITNHHINAMTIMSMSKKHKKGTRCLRKKPSFTKLSFWRSCFQLGRNTHDMCDKSGNAQFGKTQFIETPCKYLGGHQTSFSWAWRWPGKTWRGRAK